MPMPDMPIPDFTRRDVALAVMEKLLANNYFHIKEWHDRHRTGIEATSWWWFIRFISKRTATDVARGCRENLTPRSKHYEWVTVASEDPNVLGKTVIDHNAPRDEFGDRAARTLSKLETCTKEEMKLILAEIRRQHGKRADRGKPPDNGTSHNKGADRERKVYNRKPAHRASLHEPRVGSLVGDAPPTVKFKALVQGNTLALPDLSVFEGRHVEVTIIVGEDGHEDEPTPSTR